MARKKIHEFPNNATPSNNARFLLEETDGTYYYVTRQQLLVALGAYDLNTTLTVDNITGGKDINISVGDHINLLNETVDKIAIIDASSKLKSGTVSESDLTKKGTLTANYIQKATASDTIGNSQITDDGTNIQIDGKLKIINNGDALSITGLFPIYGGFGGSIECLYIAATSEVSTQTVKFNHSGFTQIYNDGSGTIIYKANTKHKFIDSNINLDNQTASKLVRLDSNKNLVSCSIDESDILTTIAGITAGGELSGTYPNPTLLNSAVIGKVLTGLNVTGGTVISTDTILEAFGKLQNQVNSVLYGAIYKGVWNASTNSPSLSSGTGTKGWYYVVNVAGSTNLDGITDWKVGDWAIFNGTTWDKVDNTDAVSSVNGYVGAVNLVSSDITESGNLYFTNARVNTQLNTYTGDVTFSSGISSIGSGKVTNSMLAGSIDYSKLASMTSAQLASIISDETGTGALVFANTPTLVTPNIGAATGTSLSLSTFLEVAEQSAPSTPTNALRIFADTSNRLSWKGENGYTRTFDGTGNTADRIYTLPDSSGTIALQSNVDSKKVFLSLSGGSTNPIDSTTYYWGSYPTLALTNIASNRRVYPSVSCTLTEITINTFIGGTLGTAENVAYYIYKNGSSSGSWSLGNMQHNTANNVLVATGGTMTFNGTTDYFEIVCITPAYSTNPTTVHHNAVLAFKTN